MAEEKIAARRLVLENIYRQASPEESATATGSEDIPRDNQKKLLALVIVGACFALAFGFWRTGTKIFQPVKNLALQATQSANTSPLPPSVTDAYGLATGPDTDGDGLVDAQEIGFYQTSPYLEDSDSDGVSDGAEVTAGTDPTCLPGAPCSRPALATDSAAGASGEAALFVSGSGAGLEAEKLRQILLDGGVDAAYLSSVSDEELLTLFASVASEPSVPAADGDVASMTPGELREFLKNNGVAPEVIGSFSDQELISLVQEIQAGN